MSKAPPNCCEAAQAADAVERRRRRRRPCGRRPRPCDCRAAACAGRQPAGGAAATVRGWRRWRADLSFFAPEVERLEFPAWDCLPYDRVSPHAGVLAQRMTDAVAARQCRGARQAVGRADHGQRRSCSGCRRTHSSLGSRCRPHRAMCCGMERVASWLELNGYTPRLDRARARRLRAARRHPRSVRAGHGRAGAARLLRRPDREHPRLRSGDAAHAIRSARARSRAGRRNSSLRPRPSAASGSAMSKPSARRPATTCSTRR